MWPRDVNAWITCLCVCITAAAVAVASRGDALTWPSDVTGGPLAVVVLEPDPPPATGQRVPSVVYLKNLSIARAGREADEPILADLRAGGHLVVVIDYAHHPAAVSPALNADLLKLRRDIADPKRRSFLLDRPIDPNRVFILPEGFRLRRDVAFARDGERVLAMDVFYPADPPEPVSLVIEITCDNVHRMGSFSLLYCRDTLLEGAALAGFAAAMVDHPVRPPYKGIDGPMPQVLDHARAAVVRLREIGPALALNGRIGAIGFSRGGPFAAMLAARGDVDAAVVHGNRYDYLNLLPADPMRPRFEAAWGPIEGHRELWAEHGAVHHLSARSSPMYLSTSDTESPEYRHGLKQLAGALERLGIDHVYREDRDARGHAVTTDPAALKEVYDWLAVRLRRGD